MNNELENKQENKQEKRCPQCGNHCPVDALKCPRGRRYFGIQEESRAEQQNFGGEEGHHHRHHEGGAHRHHGDGEHRHHGDGEHREHGGENPGKDER